MYNFSEKSNKDINKKNNIPESYNVNGYFLKKKTGSKKKRKKKNIAKNGFKKIRKQIKTTKEMIKQNISPPTKNNIEDLKFLSDKSYNDSHNNKKFNKEDILTLEDVNINIGENLKRNPIIKNAETPSCNKTETIICGINFPE